LTDYLPKDATIEQACNWLQTKTGETWLLPRLLECHLTPYFWLDYKPGYPTVYGERIEGYQTRMMFQGDLCRLESDGADALVNMFAAHDGSLVKIEPGMRVPLSDLRFKRDRVERVAEIINGQKAAPAQTATTPAPVSDVEWVQLAQTKAREYIKQQRDRNLYPSQEAIGDRIATEFRKAGIVGIDGKPLKGSYIKRHALKGISSATAKKLSTTIGRGK